MKKILIAVALLACGTRLLGQAAKNYPTSPAVLTYSDLSTKLANGQVAICSDCTKGSDPCTSGGTGAFVYKMNSVSVCGGGSGGGAGTKTLFLNFAAHGSGDSGIAVENITQTNLYTGGSPGQKVVGVGAFSNSGDTGLVKWRLPSTWSGSLSITFVALTGGTSGGNADFTPGWTCFGATVADLLNLTYSTGSLVSTAVSSGQYAGKNITLTFAMTGCSPGDWVHLTIARSSSDTNSDTIFGSHGELSGTW